MSANLDALRAELEADAAAVGRTPARCAEQGPEQPLGIALERERVAPPQAPGRETGMLDRL